MSDSISRREFIKQTAGMGVAAVVGGGIVTGSGIPAGQEGSTIAVVGGGSALKCTEKAVELAGGMGRFVAKGARVALLPNAQSRHPGSYTNPDVVRAAVRMCRAAGAEVVDALSWLPERFWQATGLDKVLEEEGAGLKISGREDELFKRIDLPEGRALKAAHVMKSLDEYDVLIDMPIIKDHAGNKFTGTMKNLMGLNSPNCNRTFHMENWETDPDALQHLDQCIADLNMAVKPDLCISDATEIITTNGPFGPGKLARPGKVIVGTDRIAMDAYGTSFLGLKPEDIIMIGRGHAHGLGEMDLSKVRILEAGS